MNICPYKRFRPHFRISKIVLALRSWMAVLLFLGIVMFLRFCPANSVRTCYTYCVAEICVYVGADRVGLHRMPQIRINICDLRGEGTIGHSVDEDQL